ncbi:hypothetical protein DIPPA_30362 [Diplonema papillatum]|nr:hypothetical protein DIPPA_30362 [Diplonema papillatum]|eukprot:gene3761-5859_t
MVEIALPDCLPQLDESQVSHSVDAERKRSSQDTATAHIRKRETAEERTEKVREYINDTQLAPFLNVMLTDLYRDLPKDPIDWCVEFLVRHEDLNAIGQREKEMQPVKPTHEIRLYSAFWKIPFLFDDLLGALLEDKPAEPDRFAAAWFRWNRRSFLTRHFKQGYPQVQPQIDFSADA